MLEVLSEFAPENFPPPAARKERAAAVARLIEDVFELAWNHGADDPDDRVFDEFDADDDDPEELYGAWRFQVEQLGFPIAGEVRIIITPDLCLAVELEECEGVEFLDRMLLRNLHFDVVSLCAEYAAPEASLRLFSEAS